MTGRQGDVTGVCAVFGQRVRAARTGRDWTLRELAAEAGVDHTTLSKIENGRGTRFAIAGRIAAAFGVPLAALLPAVACGHCLDAPPRGFTCQECGTAGPAVTG